MKNAKTIGGAAVLDQESEASEDLTQTLDSMRGELQALEASNRDYSAQIAAISRSQAFIEFLMDGIVLHANELFLRMTGYSLEDIKGTHHGMFCEESSRQS